MHVLAGPLLSPVFRLALDVAVFGAAYVAVLFVIAGEKGLYLDVFRAAKEARLADAAAKSA
ncbi:hypothetical protein D3C87_2164610 [compost metagenome]